MKKAVSTKIKVVGMLVLALSLMLICCACGGPSDTPKPGKELEKTMVLVATYNNNLAFDGETVVKTQSEYAFIKYGDEIKKENIKILSYNGDLKTLLGIPAVYDVDNGVITGVMQDAVKVHGVSELFELDGKRVVFDGEVTDAVSDGLLKDPEKYFFVFDGITLTSGSVDGKYGFGHKSDDTITLYDVDKNGTYDYAMYNPVYNALEVKAVGGGNITLSGGYGSAAYLDLFSANTSVAFKKSMAQEVPKVGDIINVTVSVDSASKTLYNNIPIKISLHSTATAKAAPLIASIYNSETDIMNRVNGDVCYWTSVTAENEMGSGREVVTKDSVGKCYNFIYDTNGYIVAAKETAVKDLALESIVSATTFQTANGTQVAGTLDIQGWWHRMFNYATIKNYISLLNNMGLRRLYFVTCNPGYPSFAASRHGYSTRRGFEAALTFFEQHGYLMPDQSFVKACHEFGIECYAIYKPYEGGGGTTAPFGAEVGYDCVAFENSKFGQRFSYEDYLEQGLLQGKDYRIIRRNDGANDNLDGTIDTIRVEFVPDTPIVRMFLTDGKTYTDKNQHASYGLNVWVSDTNGEYKLYDGSYSYTYKKDSKVLYDANGDPLYSGATKDIIVLEITGLQINEKFCALTFDDTKSLKINPYSMTHIYSAGREITSSNATYVRYMYRDYADGVEPKDYVWAYEDSPAYVFANDSLKVGKDGIPIPDPYSNDEELVATAKAAAQFYKWGFEFNWYPYGQEVRGRVAAIAFARGVEDTLPGGACEAYEEVTNAWLEHVKTLVAAGFDGVEIRLQSHSSMIPDYKNYGYNEPIVEKYKEIYGEAAYNTLMDPAHHVTDEEYIRIMRIRGDFLIPFFEDAAAICKEYGAQFSINMRADYLNPTVSDDQNTVCWWTMPKVILDWQKCVDISTYVSFKDYLFNAASVSTSGRAIREYAVSKGKEVWIQCYDDQAGVLNENFFKAVINDPTITGVTIYEVTDVNKYLAEDLGGFLAKIGFKVTERPDRIQGTK